MALYQAWINKHGVISYHQTQNDAIGISLYFYPYYCLLLQVRCEDKLSQWITGLLSNTLSVSVFLTTQTEMWVLEKNPKNIAILLLRILKWKTNLPSTEMTDESKF